MVIYIYRDQFMQQGPGGLPMKIHTQVSPDPKIQLSGLLDPRDYTPREIEH